MESLPLEVLSLIFGYAGSAATMSMSSVSKKMRQASRMCWLQFDFAVSLDRKQKPSASKAATCLTAWSQSLQGVAWPHEVTDSGVIESMSRVRTLKLTCSAIHQAPFLASLNLVEHLDLCGTNVADLTPLAGCSKLKTLDLSYCPVTDLAPLANHPQLHSLFISSTGVADLSPLAGLPTLHHLCACSCPVHDVSPLGACPRLQILCLNNIKTLTRLDGVVTCPLKCLRISGASVMDLDVPTMWAGLTELDASDVQISLTTLLTLRPLRSLQVSTLASLASSPSSISPPLESSWASAYSSGLKLTTLNLSRVELGTGELLSHCHRLEALIIDSAQLTSLAFLHHLPDLKILSMVHVTGVEDFSPLGASSGLKELDLSGTKFRFLSDLGCRNVTTLKVAGTRVNTVAGVSAFPFLRNLDVGHTPITSLDPLMILPHLEMLHACFTEVTHLPPLNSPRLRYLCLSHSPVQSISPLRFCDELMYLNITGTCVDSLAAARHLTALQTLVAPHSRVSSLEPLRDHQSLEFLTVSYSPITNLEVLSSVAELSELAFPGCPVTELSVLERCPRLQKISLDGKHANHPALRSLANASCTFFFQGDE